MTECQAILNIKGEHFQCDLPVPHDGWGHGNREAGAIWLGAAESAFEHAFRDSTTNPQTT